MIVKPMIKNYILLQKLYDALFLSLLRAVKLSFFLLCFSVSLNIQASLKWGGVGLFSLAFSEEAALNKEQAAKAVWKIQIGNIGNGSGFFISKNKIVTNFHVIEHAESIGLKSVILVQEGNPEQLKVKRIVRLSILDDLAVLEIEGSVSHFLSLPSEELNASKNLYILGYPDSKFREIRQTSVLKDDSFFADFSNSEGASGSPVLNELHQLAGVFDGGIHNLFFFKNVKALKSFIDSEHFLCKSLNVKECIRSSRETLKESIQEIKEARDYFEMAMYYKGLGGEENLLLSRELLIKSVNQGDAYVQYSLFMEFIKELGGEKDFLSGIKPLKKSAEQGYAPSQYILGVMYYYGEGVEQNFFKAIDLLEKSAEQGYAPSYHTLGVMYYYGEGVERDLFKARELLEKSTEQGYVPDKRDLANIVNYLEEGLEKKLFLVRMIASHKDKESKVNLIQKSKKCINTFQN